MRRTVALALLVASGWSAHVSTQTPQPFPRAGSQTQPKPAAPPAPATPAAPAPANRPSAPAADPSAPTAESLGFPIYPGAVFLASYDAGRGQRYYLFGTPATVVETVAFYRVQLDERGEVIFREPLTHMFEVGRFRDETMAFPPGVTVKDYTYGGSQGYPNPRLGAQPARFPTVIMIVPAPAAAAAAPAR